MELWQEELKSIVSAENNVISLVPPNMTIQQDESNSKADTDNICLSNLCHFIAFCNSIAPVHEHRPPRWSMLSHNVVVLEFGSGEFLELTFSVDLRQGWWCDALRLLALLNNFFGTYPNGYYISKRILQGSSIRHGLARWWNENRYPSDTVNRLVH